MPKIRNDVLAEKAGRLAAFCRETGCPAETTRHMIERKYPDLSVTEVKAVVDDVYRKSDILKEKLAKH